MARITIPKITLSEVFKKDLRILGFLLLNGGVAYISQTILKDNVGLSLIFGAAANYIAYRALEEMKNEGYREALK
jgi:hypothetical protein